jgi:hypothetical protein
VLAAVTLLFREVFVPVTTSRTKGPHPPCGFTCWRHERCPNYPLPEKCEYPANKHNFICFTCHIPASPSSCACHDLCGATCADLAETQRWRRHFLDSYKNLCERCRPYSPAGSKYYNAKDSSRYCACCDKCSVWCQYCLNQEKQEKSGRGVSHGLQW